MSSKKNEKKFCEYSLKTEKKIALEYVFVIR